MWWLLLASVLHSAHSSSEHQFLDATCNIGRSPRHRIRIGTKPQSLAEDRLRIVSGIQNSASTYHTSAEYPCAVMENDSDGRPRGFAGERSERSERSCRLGPHRRDGYGKTPPS